MIGLPRNEITAGEYFFLEEFNSNKDFLIEEFLPNKIDEWLIMINNTR